jgi:MSHA biogenesis protein MshQ
VELGNNVTVNLTADVNLTVSGSFKTKNGVKINSNGFVFTVQAAGDINIGNNNDVEITIISDGDIDIGNDTNLTGDVTADGSLAIKTNGSVDGTCSPSHPNCSGGGVGPPVVDAAGFNCIATGADPVNGHLYLQKVGTAFNLDVVALDGSFDVIESDYAADANRSVTVELVDASSGGACAALPSLVPPVSQTVVFGAANAGRVSMSTTVNRAYTELRCRVTDGLADPSVVACSTDRFAVRPESLTLAVPVMTNDNHLGTPKAAAGSLFTLAAEGGAGYSGTPEIDASKVTAHPGALNIGTLTGVFPAADPLTGTATATDAFSYNEVGSFRLAAQGLYDDSFAAVDIANGDCTDDFSNALVGGRYG